MKELNEQEQRKNVVKRAMKIASFLDEAINVICRLSKNGSKKDEFYFNNSPSLKNRVNNVITQLSEKIQVEIEMGECEAWTLSSAKNILLVLGVMHSMNIPKSVVEKWEKVCFDNLDRLHLSKEFVLAETFPVSIFKKYGLPINLLSQNETLNPDGLKQHLKRSVDGRTLSARVWSITEQFKEELELALDIGLGEGKSAAELSRDVRKYLNQPDKLFRRVRDKHGVLRLSKAAKAYHPGQGIYRSSYKNALRLASTEINIAYRTSDYERWLKLPFVVGIEIRLSKNHPVYDVCDELKGIYPKDFKFVGWHPHCRCFAVAVLPTQDEFLEYQNRKIAGEDVSGFKFDGVVKDLPDNFKDWLSKNKNRIERAKSLPYFIRDNKGLIKCK